MAAWSRASEARRRRTASPPRDDGLCMAGCSAWPAADSTEGAAVSRVAGLVAPALQGIPSRPLEVETIRATIPGAARDADADPGVHLVCKYIDRNASEEARLLAAWKHGNSPWGTGKTRMPSFGERFRKPGISGQRIYRGGPAMAAVVAQAGSRALPWARASLSAWQWAALTAWQAPVASPVGVTGGLPFGG